MQVAPDSESKIPARNGTGGTRTVLRLEQVEKSFRQRIADAYRVLRGINLEVSAGDFITIVGGSGAGGSTLLNVIVGSISTDSGRVRIDETDVTRLSEEDRATMISRVFQDPKQGTAPRITVAEGLLPVSKRNEPRGFKIVINESKRQESRQLLAPLKLGLEDRLNTEIGVLSGGQRQSVALIMAILKNPRLLLLDGHTAALDPKIAHKILDYTADMVAKHRLTAIMITHHLKDALNFGNRMSVMNHGEITRGSGTTTKSWMTDTQFYTMMGELEDLDRLEV